MRRLTMTLVFAATCLLPAWAMAGDQETATRVATNLKNSGRLKGYSIDVKAKDGVVVLMGKVASDDQMSAAIEVANQTPGVDRVLTQLSVNQAPTSVMNPAEMGESMRRRNPAAEQPVMARPAVAQQTPAAYEAGQIPTTSLDGFGNEAALTRATRPVQRAVPQQSGGNYMPPAPFALTGPAPGPANQQGAAQYQQVAARQMGPNGPMAEPIPAYAPGQGGGVAPAHFDSPRLPNYAWPSYSAYPNYAALTYPKQYSATAWPFIGPFYPYPQVPLGWRKVTLEWDDGWWFLDFDDRNCHR